MLMSMIMCMVNDDLGMYSSGACPLVADQLTSKKTCKSVRAVMSPAPDRSKEYGRISQCNGHRPARDTHPTHYWKRQHKEAATPCHALVDEVVVIDAETSLALLLGTPKTGSPCFADPPFPASQLTWLKSNPVRGGLPQGSA